MMKSLRISDGRTWALLVAFLLLLPSGAVAATIGDLADTRIWEQALRFAQMRDPAVRYALVGTVALGLCCGLMGCFILVRRMSMTGDALSHAVLPGVVLGFVWSGTKDPLAIFIGAVVAGLVGAVVARLIRDTTILKEDAALGLVLGGFYGAGIVLMRLVQSGGYGNQSGLDKFLFGQAAALSRPDVVLMVGVAVLVVVLVVLFYKELQVTSFDIGFARSLGLPVVLIENLIMLLLAFAVVVALQAVGVVLVSAMLILPGATAYLLTDRFHILLILASVFGVLAGATGAFLSFMEAGMPTGPYVVVAGTLLFSGAFVFAPRHGVLAKWIHHAAQRARTRRENVLKAIFHVLEEEGFRRADAQTERIAARLREHPARLGRSLRVMSWRGWIKPAGAGRVTFTRAGWDAACAVVRKHRLWELYLASAASIAADHVHDDAETIEHILDDATVRRLMARLAHPTKDPHGRWIPEAANGVAAPAMPGAATWEARS